MSNALRLADLPTELAFDRLFDTAERARWQMRDIAWDEIDRREVDDGLIALVRGAVIAEFTTYDATRQFMELFRSDCDFTQWLAVWFYEETKHPYAMMKWLGCLGEELETAEMLRGRVTQAMRSSQLTTLAINVIAEMLAAHSYLALAAFAKEPVLQQIVRHIGADEGRHASAFFTYTQQLLERSDDIDRDHAEVLKVLYIWLRASGQVHHPGNLAVQRLSETVEREDSWAVLGGDPNLHRRVCATFANLVGRDDIVDTESVRGALRELSVARSPRPFAESAGAGT